MQCPNCSIENRETAKFCSKCGYILNKNDKPPDHEIPSIRKDTETEANLHNSDDEQPKDKNTAELPEIIHEKDSKKGVSDERQDDNKSSEVKKALEQESDQLQSEAESKIIDTFQLGDVILDRYEVIKALPPPCEMSKLNCYIVFDKKSKKRCGECGFEENEEDATFCDCGRELNENYFFIFQGNEEDTKGFTNLINIRDQLKPDRIRQLHDGILQVFEILSDDNVSFVIAQNISGETLSNPVPPVRAEDVVVWSTVLGDALNFLHINNIYNPNLESSSIFFRAGIPSLSNFSTSEFIEDKEKAIEYNKKDLINLGKTLQNLTKSKMNDEREVEEDENSVNIKQKTNDTIENLANGKFDNAEAFVNEMKKIKIETEEQPEEILQQKKIEIDRGYSFLVGKSSDVGMLRELNEDSLATMEYTAIMNSKSIPLGLFIVADGMGGHEGGEIASKITINTIMNSIIEFFREPLSEKEEVELDEYDLLKKAVFLANEKICNAAEEKSTDMGTTVTAALLVKNKAVTINVGDSRTYYFNKEEGLKLITQDHSLVYRFYLMNQIEYDEIYDHPQKSQILRSLGEKNLENNLEEMLNRANHNYLFTKELKKDDYLLLCSDGLWEMVKDEDLENILKEQFDKHPQEVCQNLIQIANDNGGVDNISVILVKVQ